MSVKANYLVVPITLLVATIVTIVLAICKLGWNYYLVGTMTALLNHGLLVKQSFRIERFAKLDPEGTTLKPKRTVALWSLLRVIVFIAVFVSLAFKVDLANNKDGIWLLITAFAGFLTLKLVLIVCFLVFREKKVINTW